MASNIIFTIKGNNSFKNYVKISIFKYFAAHIYIFLIRNINFTNYIHIHTQKRL